MMNYNQAELSTPKGTNNNATKIVLALGPYQERSDAIVREWIHNVVPRHMKSLIRDATFPGRRMRPSLMLFLKDLSPSVVSARDQQRCEQVALAVELLHRASIIADDIIDHDLARRQAPTYHVTHGEGVAIIIAHFLASAAMELVVDMPRFHEALVRTYNDMCIGQLADIRSTVRRGTALDTYKRHVLKKTCGPFSIILSAAADFTRQNTTRATQLGCMLGSMYQMANDHYDVLCAPADERGKREVTPLTLSLPLALAVDAGLLSSELIGQPTEPALRKSITDLLHQTSIFGYSAAAVERSAHRVLVTARQRHGRCTTFAYGLRLASAGTMPNCNRAGSGGRLWITLRLQFATYNVQDINVNKQERLLLRNGASMRWRRLGFASYDFSNSGYVAVFQSFLFPLVLASSVAATGDKPDTTWAVLVAVSSLAAIVTAPAIGRLADRVGKGIVFAFMVTSSAALAFFAGMVSEMPWFYLAVLFLLFNALFELSQSLYDSFLLDIESSSSGVTDLSAFSWGFGYLGGAAFAATYFAFLRWGLSQGVMLSVFALMFGLLSIPAIYTFWRVHPPRPGKLDTVAISDLFSTVAPIPYIQLLIYWVIADCVAGVMYFLPLFLKQEIHLEMKVIGALLLGGQLLAFPLTFLVGKIANRVGRVRGIRGGLIVWGLGLIALSVSSTISHVVVVLIALAFVVGSTQALLRADFANRVSREASGEGLGYYAIAHKSASVISPAIVAASVALTGSLRGGFVALSALVVAALLASRGLPADRTVPQIDGGANLAK
jgi:MFS transporter, UMF1 family